MQFVLKCVFAGWCDSASNCMAVINFQHICYYLKCLKCLFVLWQTPVFDLCYSTYNDGVESSDSFSKHKELPADRYV